MTAGDDALTLVRPDCAGSRYHAGYYAAYVLDPDGNNSEVVNHHRWRTQLWMSPRTLTLTADRVPPARVGTGSSGAAWPGGHRGGRRSASSATCGWRNPVTDRRREHARQEDRRDRHRPKRKRAHDPPANQPQAVLPRDHEEVDSGEPGPACRQRTPGAT